MVLFVLIAATTPFARKLFGDNPVDHGANSEDIADNVQSMMNAGRQAFRFDTFGDEAFWGDTLKLHQAIEGAKFAGGVGAGVSPKMALAVGLKVDADALSATLVQSIQQGSVNLDDSATTLALLKMNAVLGVTGFFNTDGSLKSVGIQCAVCHSTVDNSFTAPGIAAGNIGHRRDGWPSGSRRYWFDGIDWRCRNCNPSSVENVISASTPGRTIGNHKLK